MDSANRNFSLSLRSHFSFIGFFRDPPKLSLTQLDILQFPKGNSQFENE